MSKISNKVCFRRAAAQRQVRTSIKPLAGLLILALLMAFVPARAEEADDEYLQILYVIRQADDLGASGKVAPAKAKYQQALSSLVGFQKSHPDWNTKMVTFRVKSLTEKMAALAEKPAASTNATETATGAAAQASAAQVKVLEPGAEPRKVLRLHPTPDDKQTISLTMKMAMGSKVGETATPAMKMPPITMTLDSSVKELADNGNITCTLVLSDLSVGSGGGASPEVAEMMKGVFAGLKGSSGSGTISSRGVSEGFDFKAPANSNPQTLQLMEQMKDLYTQLVVPLPEEAVGPGAKWEVHRPIKTQGMTIDQTSTYELVSLDGERLTVTDTTVQKAANQKIQNPAMPAMKVEMTKLAGKGTGERTFDLAHILPLTGGGTVHTDTTIAMGTGAQKQAMTTKLDLELQFKAK